jgi:hypothetical protein
MHPKAKAKAEPVLCAWGIDSDGKPVLLGLGPGAAESTDAWRGFLQNLTDRGLGAPLLVISDGGKGLCAAIECSLPASLHQRCLVHVCRNLIAKVPTHAQDQVKRDYWAIFDQIEAEGEAAVGEGRRRAKRFIAKWKPLYPSAVACVADNLDALLVHLLFPAEHRKRIPALQPDRADLRQDPPQGEGDRPPAWRAELPQPGLGGAGPRLQGLARAHHDAQGAAPAAGPAAPAARPATTISTRGGGRRDCHHRRVVSIEPASGAVYTARETPPLMLPGRRLDLVRTANRAVGCDRRTMPRTGHSCL